MRHLGSTNELKAQQDAEIVIAFRKIFSIYGGIVGVERIYEMVASAPAPRFFVSPERAAIVIADLRRGKRPNMQHAKARMYADLDRIVSDIQSQFPCMDMLNICRKAVLRPAPEFYKSTRQIKHIISERQHQCYATRKQRLRFCCM